MADNKENKATKGTTTELTTNKAVRKNIPFFN